jgi:hypothetical protein
MRSKHLQYTNIGLAEFYFRALASHQGATSSRARSRPNDSDQIRRSRLTTIWADPPKSPRVLSAVRLSRSTRPAARRQKYCGTMDFMPQGPRHVYFRWIRIRCVHGVTKAQRAGEAINNEFMYDWPSLLNEQDSLSIDRSSRLAIMTLSM